MPPTLVPLPVATRYITTPWPGTVALIEPLVEVTTFDHRLVSLYELLDAAPAADAVVEIVAAERVLVEQRDRDVAVRQRLGQHVEAAGGGDLVALLAERVLVDRDHGRVR